VRKISPLPGFDPRTVQSVAGRSTDFVTRPIKKTVATCRIIYDVLRFIATSNTSGMHIQNFRFVHDNAVG
jgi:hypothetical protein